MFKHKNIMLLLAILVLTIGLDAQFTEQDINVNENQTGLTIYAEEWLDYDNDGDLDFYYIGSYRQSYIEIEISRMCINNGNNNFSSLNIGLPPNGNNVNDVAIWGDYNNDGDMDVAFSGLVNGQYSSSIYRNDGNNQFTMVQTFLPANGKFIKWGDFDNDGDLDIVKTLPNLSGYTNVYRNNGDDTFSTMSQLLQPLDVSGGDTADFNSDGLLDIILCGDTANNPFFSPTTKVFINQGGLMFSEVDVGIVGVHNGSIQAGDYDLDGDMDIVITGNAGYNYTTKHITKIYRNDENLSFNDIGAPLPVINGDTDWGDYDNDGDLDLLVSGYVGLLNGTHIPSTRLYQNLGNSVFEDTQINFTAPSTNGRVIWGDYDNDGDLDVLISNCGNNIVKIFRNDTLIGNASPMPPVITIDYESGVMSMLGSDDRTLANGLTYDLKIESVSGANDVHCPPANLINGRRKITEFGRKSYKLAWPPPQALYIAAQSIDNNYQGSLFSNEIEIHPIPLINLVSQPQIEFGTAHIGYSTTEQQVVVHNWGSAPLTINDFNFLNPLSSFIVTCTLPIVVPIGVDYAIPIIFSPINDGSIRDTLFIYSNALNHQVISIGLHGLGQNAPLSVVQNISLSPTSNSIILEWEPITASIYGIPIIPDGYIVLSSQNPSDSVDDFNFVSFVNGNSFTHFGVNYFYNSMFYIVKGVMFDRFEDYESNIEIMRKMPVCSWREAKKILEFRE